MLSPLSNPRHWLLTCDASKDESIVLDDKERTLQQAREHAEELGWGGPYTHICPKEWERMQRELPEEEEENNER